MQLINWKVVNVKPCFKTREVAWAAADSGNEGFSPASRWKCLRLLLSAPGKICVGLSPRTVKHKVDGVEVLKADFGNIVLHDGVDVSGLIRSKDGKPLAGAKVVATGVLARMMANRYGNSSFNVLIYGRTRNACHLVRL